MHPEFCLVTLNPGQTSGYVVGALLPPDAAGNLPAAHSPALDLRFNRSLTGWRDDTPHCHTESEEYYLVLRGRIDLRVSGTLISVQAGQMLGVRAGTQHQVVGGEPPIENFIIRVPGGRPDKLVLAENAPSDHNAPPSLLDLRQPHSDYLLGACLPETSPYYSPRLDFNCVWEIDPAVAWRSEQLHYHTQREEYYILLRGQLNFQIGPDVVAVCAGQVLGVKAGTVHKVLGGHGPVDLLFVRVPGGRGDKVVVG